MDLIRYMVCLYMDMRVISVPLRDTQSACRAFRLLIGRNLGLWLGSYQNYAFG